MTDKIEALEAELATALSVHERVDVLNELAWELRDLDGKRGAEHARAAFDLAQKQDYPKGYAGSLISKSQYIFSNYTLAITLGRQALALYEQMADLTGQSRALYTLCWAQWSFDNFVEAVELGQRARKLAQAMGDRALEADVLNNLGLAYKRSGNYELGYAVYAEALAIYRSLGNRQRESKVLTNIALAYATQAQYQQSLAYAQESLELGVKNPVIIGYTFLVLGQSYAGLKQLEEAIPYLQQALAIASEHDNEQLCLAAMVSIGEVYIQRQELDQAILQMEQALSFAGQIQSNLYVFRCHEILSQIYETQGDLVRALAHYKEFHTVKENVFNDKNAGRLQSLEMRHKTEITLREAEIYQLRNVELEQEIAERKHLEEQLQQQAATDELTGISNRRHFLELSNYELKRAQRLNNPLSLALIDIDNFKRINDTYGHATGDQALVEFTRIFKTHIREIDLLARFGGDEFVMLLPEIDPQLAYFVLERVRLELSRQAIHLDGQQMSVTVSVGIAGLATEHDSLDSLLDRADKALYQAKKGGRNRISVG